MQKTNLAPIDDYAVYMMQADNQIISEEEEFDSKVLTYADGSKWVWLKDKPEERFVGFLYLKNALEMAGIQSVVAAPNKIALHGRKIIYLSEYAGDVHPSVFKYFNEIRAIQSVGFVDICGNLRVSDGKVYVFDTAMNSFEYRVQHEIRAFNQMHEAIRDGFEERLRDYFLTPNDSSYVKRAK